MPQETKPIDGVIQNSIPSSHAPDLKSLRLAADYGASLGVKKLLTNIHVGRPKKATFFRVHPSDDMAVSVMLLENEESRETYVVGPAVAGAFPELVRPKKLYAAIDRQNNMFFIPVPLPDESGSRNPWHESLAQAVERAKLSWLRISANQHAGGYDVFVAESALPEPDWPEHDIDALFAVAFRGRVVDNLDHPLVQNLLGKL